MRKARSSGKDWLLKDEDDTGGDLAAWLVSAASRRAQQGSPAALAPQKAHEVLSHLEALTGRTLAEPEHVEQLLLDIKAAHVSAIREGRRRRTLREAILLAALAAAYLHYYYWDVQLQMMALPTVHIFVPVHSPKDRLKSEVGVEV